MCDENLNLSIVELMERIQILESKLNGIDSEAIIGVINNNESSTWLYMLLSSLSIFLMQAGFALLEVGTVQAKNAKSILFKNTLDAAVSMMVWWVIGFGIAGIGSGGPGHSIFIRRDVDTLHFIHSYVFAGTSATIVSGAVAERMNFSAYVLFSMFMVGLIYPYLVAWGVSEGGWLLSLGYIDFAGAGIIHLCGGTAALVGATLIGSRQGRFNQQNGVVEVISIKGHSPVLSNLGTFILLFGWLSFNGSSVQDGEVESLVIACRAVQNTFLSAAASALCSFSYHSLWPIKGSKPRTHNLEDLNNAVLAGAVSITGACAYVDGWAAITIGILGFAVYTSFHDLVIMFHIDDPLDASAVHGACGLWGVLCSAFFVRPSYNGGQGGLFYTGCPRLLGIQLLGIVVITGWTTTSSLIIYTIINRIPGFHLRVDKDAELLGLDFAYHDGFAYQGLTSDAIMMHNETRAAERRFEARNKGIEFERKKVRDLKKKKKVYVGGDEAQITGRLSDSGTPGKSPFRKMKSSCRTLNWINIDNAKEFEEALPSEKAPSSTSSNHSNKELSGLKAISENIQYPNGAIPRKNNFGAIDEKNEGNGLTQTFNRSISVEQ